MKKIITFILALIVCTTSAVAEFDLSGLTFEELVALQQQVQLAMWETDGWQEVEVPAGVYEIGVDIPAGRWSLVATGWTGVTYSSALDEYGAISYHDNISYGYYEPGQEVVMNLVDGTFLCIELSSVTFTPYTNTSFSFK